MKGAADGKERADFEAGREAGEQAPAEESCEACQKRRRLGADAGTGQAEEEEILVAKKKNPGIITPGRPMNPKGPSGVDA